MSEYKKIKVNFVNNLFWIAPSITTYFRGRNFGYTPFKTLDDFINKSQLKDMNIYFSFNGLNEKNFDFYNQLQKIKGLTFRLNKENLYKIEKNNFIDDDSIDEKLLIRWDTKALKYIKKGFIPFFNKDYFLKNFGIENLDKPKILTWHKNQFIEI